MPNSTLPREIRVLPDAAGLNRAAADEFIRCAREAVAARGRFAVALAGGSTPKAVYSLLAADQAETARRLPWEKIHVFFGDERHVPPTDAESNYRMASESLLSNVSVPEGNVHRVAAELDALAKASAPAGIRTRVHSLAPQKAAHDWAFNRPLRRLGVMVRAPFRSNPQSPNAGWIRIAGVSENRSC